MNERANPISVEVDVMFVGEVPIPHAYIFRPEAGNRLTRLLAVIRPKGEVVRSPCLAFAVRHPSAGTILVDTGLHPDASENLRKDFGPTMGLFFRSLKPAAEAYEEQLRRVGVEPTQVERVIMTHLHVDHTSGMRLLPNARFACARAEWRAATASRAAGRGYVARHLPSESRMDLIDFDPAGEPHGPFSATIDLLGDGSIRLISTPGHSLGHMCVLLRVAGARQVLLVGDAAYTLRSVNTQSLPLLTANDELSRTSLRELKTFSEQEPEAILVPSHDPTAWHELRHVSKSARPAPLRAT